MHRTIALTYETSIGKQSAARHFDFKWDGTKKTQRPSKDSMMIILSEWLDELPEFQQHQTANKKDSSYE